jgi:hypothetical protein
MSHAYALNAPWDYVSSAVNIEIGPRAAPGQGSDIRITPITRSSHENVLDPVHTKLIDFTQPAGYAI